MEKKQAWIKNVEFILLGENICIEDKPNKKIINLLETYFLLINAKRPFRKMSRFLSTNWPHTYDKLILRRITIDGLCGSLRNDGWYQTITVITRTVRYSSEFWPCQSMLCVKYPINRECSVRCDPQEGWSVLILLPSLTSTVFAVLFSQFLSAGCGWKQTHVLSAFVSHSGPGRAGSRHSLNWIN